jgi:hypothetical protein
MKPRLPVSALLRSADCCRNCLFIASAFDTSVGARNVACWHLAEVALSSLLPTPSVLF